MKFEFSAGGIAYKREGNQTVILVSQHSGHHGWVFPKGFIGREVKETKEEAAVREVKEETGIEAEIEKPLDPVTYWYVFEGEKRKKTVYYFIMKATGGNTEDHDWEMEKVEWLPKDQVLDRLTYPSDKQVWKEASKLIK
jgi:8-oxo-dGTP diphosphatase